MAPALLEAAEQMRPAGPSCWGTAGEPGGEYEEEGAAEAATRGSSRRPEGSIIEEGQARRCTRELEERENEEEVEEDESLSGGFCTHECSWRGEDGTPLRPVGVLCGGNSL